jgi:hypothetical protein
MFSLRPTLLTRTRTGARTSAQDSCFIPLISTSELPLDSAPPRLKCTWSTADPPTAQPLSSACVPPQERNARMERAALGSGGPRVLLVLLFPSFFPAALTCQGFFHTLLLAGFQIEGVALYLLDDVFLLHLTLEAAQCVLKGLALLQSDFCQRNYTPRLVLFGPDSYCKVLLTSQDLCVTVGQIADDLCLLKTLVFPQKVILRAS